MYLMSFNLVDVCLFSKEMNNVIRKQNCLKITRPLRGCETAGVVVLLVSILLFLHVGTAGAVVPLVSM